MEDNELKIHAYFICYNEEPLLPFTLEHYGRFCDKITVYDNCSTDNSVEIIKSFPNTEVIPYNGHGLDDTLHTKMKNEIWKASRGKCDFVIMADIDELLYHQDIMGKLAELDFAGYTVITAKGYDMVSEVFPATGISITEQIRQGRPNKWLDKSIVFNPNAIEDINYEPGAHACFPQGNVHTYKSDGDIKILHFKFIELDRYLARTANTAERLSQENISKGYGLYCFNTTTQLTDLFNEVLKEAQEIV